MRHHGSYGLQLGGAHRGAQRLLQSRSGPLGGLAMPRGATAWFSSFAWHEKLWVVWWLSCSTESCFSMHCNEKLWLVMMASDHYSKPFCWHVCIFCKTNVQGTSTNFTGSSAKVQILLGHVYLVLILNLFSTLWAVSRHRPCKGPAGNP